MIILLEGPDNTGKSTQIRKLQTLLTDKPLHVMHYMALKGLEADKIKDYSENVYKQMFSILKVWHETSHFLLDRAHIGEVVYSPMYRNYSGNYVYDIEKMHMNHDMCFWNDVVLITIIDKSENLINRDDGLSFTTDLEKKQKEIDAFVEATNKSYITHKLILDIDGKDEDAVFEEIKSFLSFNEQKA